MEVDIWGKVEKCVEKIPSINEVKDISKVEYEAKKEEETSK